MVFLDPAVITGGGPGNIRCVLGSVHHFIFLQLPIDLRFALLGNSLALSGASRQLPKGGAKSLSLWERWHCEAMTERARPFPTNEKAPVSQGTKSPERREPVISVTGTVYHSLCCAISTAALHDRLFEANRCPYNGGLPSGPTVWLQSCRSGASNRDPLHRLAPSGGSLYAEENCFFPVNAFALCSKCFHFSKTRRPCQAVLLTMKMKRFHINGSINFQNLRVDPIFCCIISPTMVK